MFFRNQKTFIVENNFEVDSVHSKFQILYQREFISAHFIFHYRSGVSGKLPIITVAIWSTEKVLPDSSEKSFVG